MPLTLQQEIELSEATAARDDAVRELVQECQAFAHALPSTVRAALSEVRRTQEVVSTLTERLVEDVA